MKLQSNNILTTRSRLTLQWCFILILVLCNYNLTHAQAEKLTESEADIMQRKAETAVKNYYAVLNNIGSPDYERNDKELFIEDLLKNSLFNKNVRIANDLNLDGVESFAARDYLNTVMVRFPGREGVYFELGDIQVLGPYKGEDEFAFYLLRTKRTLKGVDVSGIRQQNNQLLDFYIRFEFFDGKWDYSPCVYDIRKSEEGTENGFEGFWERNKLTDKGLIEDNLVASQSSTTTIDMNTIVKDHEQNVYRTDTLNDLVWMIDNLNVRTFLNGDEIYHAKSERKWKMACRKKKPAFYVFDHVNEDSTNIVELVYNYYAVSDLRRILPSGFKVPTFINLVCLGKYLAGDTLGCDTYQGETESEQKMTKSDMAGGFYVNGVKDYYWRWKESRVEKFNLYQTGLVKPDGIIINHTTYFGIWGDDAHSISFKDTRINYRSVPISNCFGYFVRGVKKINP